MEEDTTTWKGDLKALHRQRKIYIRNLRFLNEQAAKAGRISVSMYHEIEEAKKELQNIESLILEIEEVYAEEFQQAQDLPGPLKPSVMGVDVNLPEEEDDLIAFPSTRGPGINRSSLMVLGIGGLLFIIAIVMIAWTLGRSSAAPKQAPTPSLSTLAASTVASRANNASQLPADIVIYADYYHLGDVPVEQFHAPQPDANPFVASFQVTQVGESAYLSLTAVHVDPNVEQSPVAIYLNGVLVTYLNDYVDEESLQPKTIQIPVDHTLIEAGANELQIEIASTTQEYGTVNLDDFEFWNVVLHLEP
jgi:hypothetical protein